MVTSPENVIWKKKNEIHVPPLVIEKHRRYMIAA